MSASDYLVGGNDEHGLEPPTPGKRTPVMPFLERSILEGEFNRPTKYYYLIGAARSGLNTLDIHPELSDISITERVNRANSSDLTLLITMAYNAFGSGTTFNSIKGLINFYSATNAYSERSRELAEDTYASILDYSLQKNGRGVSTLTGVGVLNSVRRPSVLVEAGFMTNLTEGRLMLDPEWQKSIGEATAEGVCDFLNVPYIDEGNVKNYPLVRRGDRGEYVKMVQYSLLINNYIVDPDGIFGIDTDRKVRQFQRDNNLSQDGIVGPQTWTKLILPNPSAFVLRNGSRGSDVRYAQNKLLSKLYPLGKADGIFGTRTTAAVKQFQTESGLSPDGIIGPLTWAALKGTASPRDEGTS